MPEKDLMKSAAGLTCGFTVQTIVRNTTFDNITLAPEPLDGIFYTDTAGKIHEYTATQAWIRSQTREPETTAAAAATTSALPLFTASASGAGKVKLDNNSLPEVG
ncbi:MAG: hypothetical protein Q7V63_08710 [Gammaproteobacteria bacterium]|nr:hypothetical protein [Gammaproteobacteria bacterium]